MTEHSHYGPLISGANEEGMSLFRIHDGGGRNAFDIGGVCSCGLGVGLEVKVSKLPFSPSSGIQWSAFQFQQIIWLKQYALCNAISLVATYYETISAMRVVKLISAADFEPGWRPPDAQVFWLPKVDGKYRRLIHVCNHKNSH